MHQEDTTQRRKPDAISRLFLKPYNLLHSPANSTTEMTFNAPNIPDKVFSPNIYAAVNNLM